MDSIQENTRILIDTKKGFDTPTTLGFNHQNMGFDKEQRGMKQTLGIEPLTART